MRKLSLLVSLGTKYIGALDAPPATVTVEPSTLTRTAYVVSFTTITEAFAGPLVGACDGDAAIDADADGPALGVALAFVDGLAMWVWVVLGFAVAVAVSLALVAAAAGAGLDEVAGVGVDGAGSTKAVGGAVCGSVEVGSGEPGMFELDTAMVNGSAAADAAMFEAGVA